MPNQQTPTDSELDQMIDNRMQQRPQKIIDAKFSLEWLIATLVTIVFSCGIVYYKIDSLEKTSQKNEAKADSRDALIQQIASDMAVQKVIVQTSSDRYQTVQKDMDNLRTQIDQISRNQRWMPK